MTIKCSVLKESILSDRYDTILDEIKERLLVEYPYEDIEVIWGESTEISFLNTKNDFVIDTLSTLGIGIVIDVILFNPASE